MSQLESQMQGNCYEKTDADIFMSLPSARVTRTSMSKRSSFLDVSSLVTYDSCWLYGEDEHVDEYREINPDMLYGRKLGEIYKK